MSLAKITLLGMQQWMLAENNSLFGTWELPAGMEADVLIDRILFKGAEFEVLYANPYIMQDFTRMWADTHYATFERWVRALSIEYDPLENYDRKEEWSDAGSRNKSGSRTDAAVFSENNEVKTGNTSISNRSMTDDNEHSVSAYDASTYQPDNKDARAEKEHNSTAASTTTNGNAKNQTSSLGSDKEAEQHNAIHSGRTHGNIGVTTSQQMLEAEWEVAKLNIYDEAADMYLQELCVYTY